MYSVSVYVLFLTVAVAVFLHCSAQFPPRGEDEQICKDNAGDRTFVKATKTMANNCKVTCEYEEGSEVMNSKDGELCCDIVAAPTGRCKDGVCPVGSF